MIQGIVTHRRLAREVANPVPLVEVPRLEHGAVLRRTGDELRGEVVEAPEFGGGGGLAGLEGVVRVWGGGSDGGEHEEGGCEGMEELHFCGGYGLNLGR